MWEWLGVLGIGGIGALGVGAWFLGVPAALGIVNSTLQVVTPFLKSISEFIVWYLEELWESVKIVYKNPNLMVLLLTVGIITGVYGSTLTHCNVEKVIEREMPLSPHTPSNDWDPFGIW